MEQAQDVHAQCDEVAELAALIETIFRLEHSASCGIASAIYWSSLGAAA